jgi:hypothetical protein
MIDCNFIMMGSCTHVKSVCTPSCIMSRISWHTFLFHLEREVEFAEQEQEAAEVAKHEIPANQGKPRCI